MANEDYSEKKGFLYNFIKLNILILINIYPMPSLAYIAQWGMWNMLRMLDIQNFDENLIE